MDLRLHHELHYRRGAESIVDESSPLERIPTEFMMCDGPAWDGSSSLFVPEVKSGKLYRYRPAQKKLDVAITREASIAWPVFLRDPGPQVSRDPPMEAAVERRVLGDLG